MCFLNILKNAENREPTGEKILRMLNKTLWKMGRKVEAQQRNLSYEFYYGFLLASWVSMSSLQLDWSKHMAASHVADLFPGCSTVAGAVLQHFCRKIVLCFHCIKLRFFSLQVLNIWNCGEGSHFKTQMIQPVSTCQNHRTSSLLKVKPGFGPLLPHQPPVSAPVS